MDDVLDTKHPSSKLQEFQLQLVHGHAQGSSTNSQALCSRDFLEKKSASAGNCGHELILVYVYAILVTQTHSVDNC